MADHTYFANLTWQIADLLRGPYRPPQYEPIMLPLTVLRRFDCVLAPTLRPLRVRERNREDERGEHPLPRRDAWMDRSKDKVGYEINFNRHFYRYTPPRPLEEIDRDLKEAEKEIMRLLGEVIR